MLRVRALGYVAATCPPVWIDTLKKRCNTNLRVILSPRHVPWSSHEVQLILKQKLFCKFARRSELEKFISINLKRRIFYSERGLLCGGRALLTVTFLFSLRHACSYQFSAKKVCTHFLCRTTWDDREVIGITHSCVSELKQRRRQRESHLKI